MADNLTTTTTVATIPNLTKVTTDDCGANGHTQVVKLAISTDGSATLLPSDGTDGLLVNLGANNDVTVTSGAITATLAAGTNTNEVVGDVAHDAVAAGNPLLQGGYASAAAPSDVSADGDAVRAWRLRNGAGAVVVTAAGALIGGDAANGLDVDVTRVTGTVTIAGAVTNAGTFAVQPGPTTSGGLSIFHLVAAGSDNATNVKASAGQVYAVEVFNNAATPRYVKFHNTAGTPTAGAAVVMTVAVQAGTARTVPFPQGVAFGTGIGITMVTGITDASSVAVTASDLVLDVLYK